MSPNATFRGGRSDVSPNRPNGSTFDMASAILPVYTGLLLGFRCVSRCAIVPASCGSEHDRDGGIALSTLGASAPVAASRSRFVPGSVSGSENGGVRCISALSWAAFHLAARSVMCCRCSSSSVYGDTNGLSSVSKLTFCRPEASCISSEDGDGVFVRSPDGLAVTRLATST